MTDVHGIIARLSQTAGDPRAFELATLEVILEAFGLDLKIGVQAAAIPHWFNEQILGKILKIDTREATFLIDRLKHLPIVESFASRGGWNVREPVRLALRYDLATAQPDLFRHLSKAAVECFNGEDLQSRAERIYHRLVAEPTEGGRELTVFSEECRQVGQFTVLETLDQTLKELRLSIPLEKPALVRSALYFADISSNRLSGVEVERFASEAALFGAEIRDFKRSAKDLRTAQRLRRTL